MKSVQNGKKRKFFFLLISQAYNWSNINLIQKPHDKLSSKLSSIIIKPDLEEHNYSKPSHLKDAEKTNEHKYAINEEQIYNMQQKSLIIPAQYADDCGCCYGW